MPVPIAVMNFRQNMALLSEPFCLDINSILLGNPNFDSPGLARIGVAAFLPEVPASGDGESVLRDFGTDG